MSDGSQLPFASPFKPAITPLSHVKVRLVALALSSDSSLIRAIRRPLWRFFYKRINGQAPDADARFMNLGYVENASAVADGAKHAADSLQAENVDDLVSAQLYNRALDRLELEGRSVVEVGCGYGTGCAHMANAYRSASLLGLDLSDDLITRCREAHHAPNLGFRQADAQNLPLPADSVDVVVNIESSHCYPSRSDFFAEVARVLRPGGSFVLADIFAMRGRAEGPDSIPAMLAHAGLEVRSSDDITANVLAARDTVWRSPTYHARVQAEVTSGVVPERMLRTVHSALFLPGSLSYNWMSAGRFQYWSWHAVKPVAAV
jgi:SAM-dependent methyltransferase